MEVETSIGDLSESILEPGGAVEPVTTKVWVCRICWLAGYGAATTQVSE